MRLFDGASVRVWYKMCVKTTVHRIGPQLVGVWVHVTKAVTISPRPV